MTKFVDHSIDGTDQADVVHDDEARSVDERMGSSEEGLSTVRVSDGDGLFLLTVALAGAAPHIAVDIAPGTLRLRHGRVSRYVRLPDDALFDQAVIQHSEDQLTVTIPERERRECRHIIHVW